MTRTLKGVLGAILLALSACAPGEGPVSGPIVNLINDHCAEGGGPTTTDRIANALEGAVNPYLARQGARGHVDLTVEVDCPKQGSAQPTQFAHAGAALPATRLAARAKAKTPLPTRAKQADYPSTWQDYAGLGGDAAWAGWSLASGPGGLLALPFVDCAVNRCQGLVAVGELYGRGCAAAGGTWVVDGVGECFAPWSSRKPGS